MSRQSLQRGHRWFDDVWSPDAEPVWLANVGHSPPLEGLQLSVLLRKPLSGHPYQPLRRGPRGNT